MNAQTLANQSNQRLRLVVSGETCLALHNVEEARKFFNAAIKISPNNVDAIVGVASVDLLEGNFDAARKKIEQAITIVPNSAWPRLLRARVDFEQGNREAAEKQLTSILTSKNLDGASLVEAGSLFLAMNHLDRAAFCAQRALQIDAKDKGAKRLLATITAEEQKTTRQ